MRKLKMRSIISMVLLALSSGCGTVEIRDIQFCTDEGPLGAHCNNLLTDAPVNLDKPDWDNLRFGMTCISDQAQGEIKREIEELCSSASCSYDVKKKIAEAMRRLGVQ